jgi:hypothetical protein
MSGGAFIKFDAGSVGSAADNAAYITREPARDGGLVLHNAPEDVAEVEDPQTPEGWAEQRMRFQTWAETRETEEIARHGNRKGQPRTHYRVVLSYEDKIETAEAQEDAREWLEEEFPGARAAAVVHQDTENTHVHVWMSPRLEDGSKINISPQDFRDLTAEWDRIYEQRMQRPGRLREKMEETRTFKRQFAELKEQGASAAELQKWAEENRPFRADPPSPEVYRQRDRRRLGVEEAEKAESMMETRAYKRKRDRESVLKQARSDLQERQEAREAEEDGGKAQDENQKEAQEQASREQSQEQPTKQKTQSHERHQERAGRDERGAEPDRPEVERGESATHGREGDQGHERDRDDAEARKKRAREPDRERDGSSRGGRERSEGASSGGDRNRDGAFSDGGDNDPDRLSTDAEDAEVGGRHVVGRGGRSSDSGSDVDRMVGAGESGLSEEEIKELNRRQRKILRLLRKVSEAGEDEDVSQEESDLDYQLGTARKSELEELREKMTEEQERALYKFQQQYQDRGRGR